MKTALIGFLIACAMLVAVAEGAEKPSNIFDDDWTPPKATPRPLVTSVAFRVLAQTDSTNIRLAYACDDIIFNWENNANELRINGGPGGGKHKPGPGAVPTKT